jgi:hypothetical protein
MVTEEDFLLLKCPAHLIQQGVDYARRSLAFTYNRMGGTPFARLRRIVGGVAVELALRHYLHQKNIPHHTAGSTPFTDPDRYDIAIHGRPCDLKSFLILEREKIRRVHHRPALLLEAPALVPADQLHRENHTANDLYLFAFMTTLVGKTAAENRRIAQRGLPAYWIKPLPRAWSRPKRWAPLHPLYLKSEAPSPLTVEIGGQDVNREFICERLVLPPKTRLRLPDKFYSVAYLHAAQPPAARVGIHAPRLGAPCILRPEDWGNIWLYPMRIYLVGYISWERFRRESVGVPANTPVFQYKKTRIKNYALPVAQLLPIARLLG